MRHTIDHKVCLPVLALLLVMICGGFQLSHASERSFAKSRDNLMHLLRSKIEQSRKGRLESNPPYTRGQTPRSFFKSTRARTIPDKSIIDLDVDNVPSPPLSSEAQSIRGVEQEQQSQVASHFRPEVSTISSDRIDVYENRQQSLAALDSFNLVRASTQATQTTTLPPRSAAYVLESNTNNEQLLRKAFIEFLVHKMNANIKNNNNRPAKVEQGVPLAPPQQRAQQSISSYNFDSVNSPNAPLPSLEVSSEEDETSDSSYDSLTLEEVERLLRLDLPQTTTPPATTTQPTKIQPRSTPVVRTSPRPDLQPAKYDLSTSDSRITQLFRQVNKGHTSSRRDLFGNLRSDDGDCGGIINITTYVDITSPNYPSHYPPNMDCRWEIYAPQNQKLHVKINKLSIEHDDGCRFDYLDIKGVQSLDEKTNKITKHTRRICGHYLNGEEFMIGTDRTVMMFHSDLTNQMQGFFLTVTAESMNECTQEMHILNTTYLTSPKYPQLYGSSENCWTTLSAQNDHRLLLHFEDLKLEGGAQCEFDFVEVFDSDRPDAKKSLGKFCQLPANSSLLLASSGQQLLFHFATDDLVAMRGFKVKINSLRKDVNVSNYMSCNWDVDWKNMTIASPFYPKPYPPNTQCETSISALSTDERIIILFDWIDLVNADLSSESSTTQKPLAVSINSTRCQLDRLEIWESTRDTEPSTILCGYRIKPFKYISKGSSIKLVFKSSGQMDTSRTIQNRQRQHFPDGYMDSNTLEVNPGFQAKFAIISANLYNKMNTNSKNNSTALVSKLAPVKSNTGMIPLEEIADMEGVAGVTPSPSPPVLIRRPENASVMLGSSHILHCEIGHPNRKSKATGIGNTMSSSSISWFKGDREIHDGVAPDGSSLLIRQFNLNSAGRYICVFGDNSSDAWLTVKEDTETCRNSSVLFRARPKDQYTSEGEFVMLHCSATLSNAIGEDAEITWEKLPLRSVEGDPSSMQPKPVVYNSRIRKLKRGDLLFDTVFVEDSGYYSCVVRLNGNNARMTYQLDSNENKDEGLTPDQLPNDCSFNSVTRVQINQRVEISQYCGRSTVNKHEGGPMKISEIGKIIGGTEAQLGEFPWMVMFWDEKRHVFCGGALVNERWVVTAAHCFTDISDESTVFVKLGKYDQTSNEPAELATKIQHIIRHPQFSNETFDNDIALVKLVKHITFTNYILPICLPQSSDEVTMLNSIFFADDPTVSASSNEELKYGYVTGWGRLKENGPLPRYLHKIRLPIVQEDKCRASTSFRVTENMFCAGYGKEVVGDACKGDSGGPFAVIHENRWTLLGIVSWGEGCGRPEKFGYYTKVNNFENWIRRLTKMS